MNRRSFLSSCLALAAAPAIVRADSLMRIVPREATIILPTREEISLFYSRVYEFTLCEEEERILNNLLFGGYQTASGLEDLLAP